MLAYAMDFPALVPSSGSSIISDSNRVRKRIKWMKRFGLGKRPRRKLGL